MARLLDRAVTATRSYAVMRLCVPDHFVSVNRVLTESVYKQLKKKDKTYSVCGGPGL
jgi:hypothetical protein